VSGLEGGSGGEWVARGTNDGHDLIAEGHDVHVAVALRVGDDAEVTALGANGFVDGFGAVVVDGHTDLGGLSLKGLGDFLKEVDARGVDGVDANLAGRRAAEAGQALNETVVAVEDLAALTGEEHAGRGQGEGAHRAVDEDDVEAFLELPNALAGSGLGNTMALSRRAEAAGFGDGAEQAQRLHRRTPLYD